MKIIIHCFLSFIIFSLFINPANANDDSLQASFIALAIQGDLRPAHALFEQVDLQIDDPADRLLAEHFRQRFIEMNDDSLHNTGNVFVDDLLSIYRRYWTASLLGSRARPDNLDGLRNSLAGLLGYPSSTASSAGLEQLHIGLRAAARSEGYWLLADEAPPLQDLILWKTEETRRFSVRLTDETREVDVVFMDEFGSLGWKNFATLGLATTTGWVEDGRLYCVDWAYNRDSENFRVSYLKHETRHLADYEKFPGLDAAELEYRAKLTELAFSYQSTFRLLEDFTNKAARNPESPHAQANYKLTRNLHQQLFNEAFSPGSGSWSRITTGRVNQAARELLEISSMELAAKRH
jgi:hypothetical protein